MITGELKSKVDRIWDTMWSGGISNPLSVIEQLTYLLFIKRLDELHTLKERKAARTGKPIEEPVFTARPGQPPLVALQGDRPRADVRDGARRGVPLHQDPRAEGGGRRRGRLDLHPPHEGRALHDAHGPGAGQRGRPARRHRHGRQRHQGRPLRVHARQDRHRRAERPVPHPAPHHQADGGHDRAHAEGRDLRPGLRHGGLPDRRLRVPASSTTATPSTRTPPPAAASTRAPSTATTSTTPCCASAA